MEIPTALPAFRVDGSATFDLSHGPIALSLATHRLDIVNPMRDLSRDERLGLQLAIDCYVVDPATLNPARHTGFKALRPGAILTLGTGSTYDRFAFEPTVSETHARIRRDGSRIRIIDADSRDGVFIMDPAFAVSSFAIGSYSVASALHPRQNYDAYFADQQKPAVGVFDGVGSLAERGGLAARVAREATQQELQRAPSMLPIEIGMLTVKEALRTAHAFVNRAVPPNTERPSIATTATAAKFFRTPDGQPYAAVASAGDSRAYLLRRGQLTFLTLDQPYTGKHPSRSSIRLQDKLARAVDLSELNGRERTAFERRKIIDSGLGYVTELSINTNHTMLAPGDVVLLTTDGVTDRLTTPEMEQAVRRAQSVEQLPEQLVMDAVERGTQQGHMRAGSDDMTVQALAYVAH